MRLFTAVWPDAAARADAKSRLAAADTTTGTTTLRPHAPERLHMTLCFHGDADPDDMADRLRAADLGAAAGLNLRCHGVGTFGWALWLGVEADDPARLRALVAAAGHPDPDAHVAHLTIASAPRGRSATVPADLPTGPGPWWPVRSVDLVASGSPFRTVARVAVA